MTYSISIYAFEGQLVYTAAMDMYFDKYKGVGHGYYSEPILVSSLKCSVEDIEAAICQCINVLQDHQDVIFRTIPKTVLCRWKNVFSKTSSCLELLRPSRKSRNNRQRYLYDEKEIVLPFVSARQKADI